MMRRWWNGIRWRRAIARLREINARGGHATWCDTQSERPTTRRQARLAAQRVDTFTGRGVCMCSLLARYSDRWWEQRQRRVTVDGSPFPWVGQRWTSVDGLAKVTT